MKFKFILGLATATMFLATSCSQEEFTTPVSTGDEGTISLAVNVPEGIQSRAFGDGTRVDQLQYALYRHERNRPIGNQDPTFFYIKKMQEKVSGFTGTHNLKLTLPTGYDYILVFWADKSGNSSYTVTFGDNEAKMTLTGTNGAISSNDESNDAFFAFYEFTVSGALTGTIELKRPFAQINFLTNDLEKYLDETGYDVLSTSIKVEGNKLPDTLDLMTGKVSSVKDVSYIFFNSTDYRKGETIQGDDDYAYLTMAYFLIGEEQQLFTVKLGYYGLGKGEGGNDLTLGGEPKERTVENVPLRRNYRTNIYGKLLTTDFDLDVTVTPAFEEGDLEPESLE